MKISLHFIVLLLLGSQLFMTNLSYSQEEDVPDDETEQVEEEEETENDDETDEDDEKSFNEIITDSAQTMSGMFTVHKVDDKHYFEIPDSLFGRDILAVTRFSKTPTGLGYGGEKANQKVFRFVKGPKENVFIEIVQFINISDEQDAPITTAVENSNMPPIAAAFDIKAERKDTSVLIEVTKFLKKPNQAFSLNPRSEKMYKLSQIQDDRSYIKYVHAYPMNVEIKSVRTYKASPPSLKPNPASPTTDLPAGRAAGFVTMELSTSMYLLPKEPAEKRLFDPRVGIFATGYNVYSSDQQRVDEQVFTVRWPLEAKNQADIEKQKNGIAVEPKEPIVFYIDPATPEKWRPYLMQGIEDWQVAFEQAGWKNAIQAKEWPENDSTMSLEDARFSKIRYFASNVQNAYGPNVHDPRSGEIIHSNIGWYHNVMKLLKNWYTTQTAAVDPRARANELDDDLMGELIRFVAAHEVGHTLGLRHNFGASFSTPVEKLRDAEWLAENPHTSSIMDYARFNYVAQPDDDVGVLFPGIGEYDKWAIEWNYKPIYGTDSPEEDRKILNEWYLEKAEGNPKRLFLTEASMYDPRAQSEDLGNNSMKASEYGIENLKRIVPNIIDWTEEEAQGFDMAQEAYSNVFNQYRRYVGHVTKWIGGIYETPKTYDQEGVVFEPAPKDYQVEAVAFLQKHVFQRPRWLLNQEVTQQLTPERGLYNINQVQESTINSLYSTSRLQRLIDSKAAFPEAYGLLDFYDDMNAGIWAEMYNRTTANVFRRNLQKIHLDKLIDLLEPSPSSSGIMSDQYIFRSTSSVNSQLTDISSLTRGSLQEMADDLKKAARRVDDRLTKFHYQDCRSRILDALEKED